MKKSSTAEKAPATLSHTVIASGLIWNLLSSISVIFVNKWLYKEFHFPNITLTCLHFVVTSLGLLLCERFGVFQRKPVPLAGLLPLSISFCGFVVLTNLSLQYNTVGTYQLVKVMTTPCIVVIQTIFYSKTFSLNVKLTLIPIAFGVFLNSSFDLRFSAMGILFGSCGVVATSLYQIWVGSKQHEYQLTSMQLLFYQAPLSAVMLSIPIVIFEPTVVSKAFLYSLSAGVIILAVTSGVIALSVNLSIYWVIGNTSALTYNMFGHLKFCLTMIGGFLLFGDPLQPIQFLGILITFGGVLAYTHFKLQEQRAAAAELLKEVSTDDDNDEESV